MKVLLSGNTGFSLYNYRYKLMKKLHSEGKEIVCLAEKDWSKKKIEENDWKFIDLNINRRGKNIFQELNLLYQYFKIFRKEKPDIILSYTIKPNVYGNIIAGILRIPVINNVTGLGDTFSKKGLLNFIVKKMYKISLLFSSKIFFQNSDDLQLFLENKLVDKEKVDLLPGSGVDLEEFRPINEIVPYEKETLIFLYIGRIIEKKGVRLINDVSKKISKKYKNVEFHLLGGIYEEDDDITLEEIKKWEEESNLKYIGFQQEVKNYIGLSDCIIFPSYYREGTPRSLIEAASMGRPIITTDSVGCKEVVQDGYNGFLVLPKDEISLYDSVEKFIKLSEEDKMKLGKNSRKKAVLEFDVNIIIKKYIDIIDEILRNKK